MKNRTAFCTRREVSKRAETGSSAQSTDANDQVRKKTVTYASHGWSRKSSGIVARRAASAVTQAIASTKPAALSSVSPLVGEPGSWSKKVRTTKNASPPGRLRNATPTNAMPTTAASASVGERTAATPINTPPSAKAAGNVSRRAADPNGTPVASAGVLIGPLGRYSPGPTSTFARGSSVSSRLVERPSTLWYS